MTLQELKSHLWNCAERDSRVRSGVTWDPEDYARSSSAQLIWAREMISRLNLAGHEHILDIGSGDGNLRHVRMVRLEVEAIKDSRAH